MATINFSIPGPIKEEFNTTFAGENKSAILTRLVQEAVEQRRSLRQRSVAIDAILELRRTQSAASDAEVARARAEFRR